MTVRSIPSCILLLLAGGVCADGGLTPVLTLPVGETVTLGGSQLNVVAEHPWLVGAPPAGLRLRGPIGRLELTAKEPLPWVVVSTNKGDLLARTRDGVPLGLEYRGAPGQAVSVAGSFNDWSSGSHPLVESEPGHYRITLQAAPGELAYQLVVDGKWMLDPANPDSMPNGLGGWNSRKLLADEGGAAPVLRRLGWRAVAGGRELRFLAEDLGEDGGWSWAGLHGNSALAQDAVTRRGDTLVVKLGAASPAGPDRVRFAVSRGTRRSQLQTVFLESDFVWQDAVVYALMPDRFRNGDPSNDDPVTHPELLPPANWQGGDLAGIRDALREGYFRELGVSTLWIYPLNESTDKAWQEYPAPHRWYTGYHGYWPVHPTRIEPRFGDSLLFKEVVDTAHGQGLRVMLDLVANHVHEEHPWVREHPEWFGSLYLPDGRRNLRIWDEHRLTTWFEPYMPDIDYSPNPAAMDAMCETARRWVDGYKLDGFRHDAVKHVPREFWEALTRWMKAGAAAERPFYQIGETFGSDELIASYIGPDAMDAQFNFNLFHPAREVFLDSTRSFAELAGTLGRNLSFYGPNSLMGNLMDSHDKARWPSLAEGDLPLSGANGQEVGWTNPPRNDDPTTYQKTRLFLTWLLGLPGVPFLYYGDEIAMAGAEDPDNRRMMRFGEQLDALEREQLAATAELVKLRNQRPELRRGDLEVLHADRDLLVFLRSAEDATGRPSRSLVALNKSGQARAAVVELPLGLGMRKLSLEAWEGKILPL
jgi:cyclomaltodextrinase